MKFKILFAVSYISYINALCYGAPDWSGVANSVNLGKIKEMGVDIVKTDKFKKVASQTKSRINEEFRNIIKADDKTLIENFNQQSVKKYDVPLIDKYNYQELVNEGFDVVIDDQNHKVEIPLSKPRNVLKLTEFLINAIIDREENENVLNQMSEMQKKIGWLLDANNEDLDQIFCKNYDIVYSILQKLSESLDGRLLELKKLFENLMFFMRVSAYTIKLNKYFEKHEEEILKRKQDLQIFSKNYNLIDIPPELIEGVNVGIGVKHKHRIGKTDGIFVKADDVSISGKVGYAFNVAIDKLASVNAEIELNASKEKRYLNSFAIASLQDDIWSDKNYSKFKALLTVLLHELSSLKENLYNLDIRLKTIGIIKNDLSYYFDRGQYTTEYVKSFSFGGRITANVSVLHDIGLDASLCYRISRHKKGKNHVPDNIKNYSVILNNREYALSLVKLFNSGKKFGDVLDGESYEFEENVKSKGIHSITDLRFQIDNYVHALMRMYQQDNTTVERYRDLKHTVENDLSQRRRREMAEFFAQVIAYFCFYEKDFNGNTCDIKELTSLKDSLMLIINTLEDSKSIFSSRRTLRSKKAYSHDVTANVGFGEMIDFYCQFNEKKTRIYENGQLMHIDLNTSLLNWLNTTCISKLPINQNVREALGEVITNQNGELVSNVFFKICDQIKSRVVGIVADKSNTLNKYVSLGLSLFSNVSGKLKDTILSNCKAISDKAPFKALTDVNVKDSHIRIDFVANSMEEKYPIMTRISSAPDMAAKVNLLTGDGTVAIKEPAVVFINVLTVYELVKDFIVEAMEYEANHGTAVTLKKANDFVNKYKFIDHLVKSAKKGLLNSSYLKYANATKHGLAFQQSLRGESDDEIKRYLSMLVYHYYLDKAKPFFESSFK